MEIIIDLNCRVLVRPIIKIQFLKIYFEDKKIDCVKYSVKFNYLYTILSGYLTIKLSS